MNFLVIPQESYQYIQTLGHTYPQYKDLIDLIDMELNQRLWHQLSQHLLQLCCKPELQSNQELITLYNQLIVHIQTAFNPMKFLSIIQKILTNYTGRYKEALLFIENIEKNMKFGGEENLYISILKGYCFLELGQIYDLEDILKKVKLDFEQRSEIDPVIYSNYYRLSTYFYEKKHDYDSYYYSALQYLAYEKDISEGEKIELCFNMCVSTLIGEKMFNFAELIEKDFFKLMKGSKYEWIYNLIFSFNSANVQQFEEILKKYQNEFEAVPILKNNKDFLIIKIRIAAFLELIFQKNKGERIISFTEIRDKCGVQDLLIEFIIMKALSFGLIKGYIDQVEQCVHVTWVMPKYLDKEKLNLLLQRFDSWIGKSKDMLSQFQELSAPLIV